MTKRVGLRAKLTLFVTLVFGLALSLVSVLALEVVEDRLIADTRASAEAVLSEYLDSSNGVVTGVAIVDPAEATRFFYLDADGGELTERQFYDMLFADFRDQVGGSVVGGPIPFGAGDTPALPVGESSGFVQLTVDPVTGDLVDADGVAVLVGTGPMVEGAPHPVDLGNEVVAVAQSMVFADGSTVEIGVSSPLRPVTGSLDTIRRLLWLAVPLLSLVTAVITWLAATSALKPVHELTQRAQAITAANIDDRLPVSGAKDEIRELATTMNDMLTRLDSAQSKQRQFISDASHELRSPVAVSKVQLEVAQANPGETDWVTTAEVVLAEQERLSDLIDDLLALSRMDETGAGKLSDVDLDDLVSSEAARVAQVVVGVDIAGPVRVSGNLALLTSAVRNLLDNASRHAGEHVGVTLLVEDGLAVLHVDDDGPGISAEERQVIFDRFTRLDEARDRHSGGSGLGLAITREVALAHGGGVEVSVSPLGGARFTLHLPLSPS